MSLAEVGAELRSVIDELTAMQTRAAGLAKAARSARERLALLGRGSEHELLSRAQAQVRASAERLDEAAVQAGAAAEALRDYLRLIGVGEGGPAGPATSGRSGAVSDRDVAIARVRDGLPRGKRGTRTQGAWVGADEKPVELSSGKEDEWYGRAKEVAATFPATLRAAARLAVHLEVKFAVRMRDEGRQRETIVIDREVCGRGATDQGLPFTCDKMLRRFLAPGAELTVVERDGTRRTYRGDDVR